MRAPPRPPAHVAIPHRPARRGPFIPAGHPPGGTEGRGTGPSQRDPPARGGRGTGPPEALTAGRGLPSRERGAPAAPRGSAGIPPAAPRGAQRQPGARAEGGPRRRPRGSERRSPAAAPPARPGPAAAYPSGSLPARRTPVWSRGTFCRSLAGRAGPAPLRTAGPLSAVGGPGAPPPGGCRPRAGESRARSWRCWRGVKELPRGWLAPSQKERLASRS